MQYIVGLTGLIGSGKSIASKIFEEIGIKVIDTDLIAHQITSVNGIAIPQIIKQFGVEYINLSGELNRLKMRNLVFSQPNVRKQLEKILHPIIFMEVLKQVKANSDKYIVLVVPLLFKSFKYLSIIHRSIFIDCDETTLFTRVVDRSNMTKDEIQTVLTVQVTRDLQLRLCDDILYNNGSILELKEQIINLNDKYQTVFVA